MTAIFLNHVLFSRRQLLSFIKNVKAMGERGKGEREGEEGEGNGGGGASKGKGRNKGMEREEKGKREWSEG